jgi:hypothetical protein
MIFLISFTLISCDGRSKRYKSNREILQNHDLLESFSKSITYIPQAFIKTHNDTILSNGYRVKIESYTDMENSYIKSSIKNNIQHINYYRNIKASIEISKNSKESILIPISQDILVAKNKSLEKPLKNKLIKGIWIDEYASNMSNQVIIDILFYEPETNNTVNYSIVFDEKGILFINDKLKKTT